MSNGVPSSLTALKWYDLYALIEVSVWPLGIFQFSSVVRPSLPVTSACCASLLMPA